MYKRYIKRAFDVLLASLVFICLFWLCFLISLLIRWDSKGPIIYKQKRVGVKGNEFLIYKFRTMVMNADKIGEKYTTLDDPRITRIGSILRKYSFDELPQLLNVIKGDMSLIGPRPGIYVSNIKRLEVLPGITGLAQVNGRSSLSKREKDYYDNFYVDNLSLMLDIKILFKTMFVVMMKKGVN